MKKLLLLTLSAFLLSACVTTNPATGEREFTLVTPDQEAALGAEQNPIFVEQFGGAYNDQDLQAYVTAVGNRLAQSSEMASTRFEFTVLDSSIINAFALPGGYVSISRGLMAYFNDEAELAGVLGHEVGHVTARHYANRYTRATLYGGLAGIAGIASGSETLAGIANTGASLYLLHNSRGQETQSDRLAVRYMSRTGYDLMGAVRMLERLVEASGRATGAASSFMEAWSSTHPADDKRIARARETVAATPQPSNPIVNRNTYLNAIDGMVFGDDPRRGAFRGDYYVNTTGRYAFTRPDGFTVAKSGAYVVGGAENAQFAFKGDQISSSTSTRAYVDQVWEGLFEGGAPQGLGNYRNLSTGGMDGVSASTRLNQEGGAIDVTIVAWRYDGTRAYHFLLLSAPEATSTYQAAFSNLVNSFRKLSSTEAAAIKPTRIRVITVQSGDTISSLANQMQVEGDKERLFRVLNGLTNTNAIQRGQLLKLVVEG